MAQLMESGSSDVSEYSGVNPVGMPPKICRCRPVDDRELFSS